MGDGRHACPGLAGRCRGECGGSCSAVVRDGDAHAIGGVDRGAQRRTGSDERSAFGCPAPAISEAIACAACSEVPHPVTVTGRAAASAEAISSAIAEAAGDGLLSICSARVGCAVIISCMTHGGPERNSG